MVLGFSDDLGRTLASRGLRVQVSDWVREFCRWEYARKEGKGPILGLLTQFFVCGLLMMIHDTDYEYVESSVQETRMRAS